jgi:hypothetical protein
VQRGAAVVWVCGRSLAGTAGSNPPGGMDVYCELLCVVRYVSATGRSLLQRSSTECVCNWVRSGARINLYTYNDYVEDVRIRKEERKKRCD